MSYHDLRDFLVKLEEVGDLARVSVPVALEHEIGAIARKTADARGPALVFERPGGYESSLAIGLLGERRRCALALDADADHVIDVWNARAQKRVSPVWVDRGPCKENVLLGDDIDLFRFPLPTLNELDGGPYITFPCHISKDPETGARNVGVYRCQVHDKRTLGILAVPYRHIMIQRAKRPREPFPVALAVGLDPATCLAVDADLPFGADEFTLAGALRGAPLELVKCETVPLEVPANAEIVIEGYILPEDRRREGPFGEFTGYYGTVADREVIQVTAITHRNNPIHQVAFVGRPPCEDVQCAIIAKEAAIVQQLGLPGLKKVRMTEGGCGYFNCIASIEKPFEGYAKMMAMAILGLWPARAIKTLILVDTDIDPFNEMQVEWALATRMQPHRDVEILKDLTGVALDPSLPESERTSGTARTSKMIIDATKYDAKTYEIEVNPHPAVMAQVERDWAKYGIDLADQRAPLRV